MASENGNATGAESTEVHANRQLIQEARGRGPGALFGAFLKLSGPGWLQSAITLGGGSLASSLYLGVLAGTALLWLQPLAMIIGVIMLSAISYVVLSTGQRPFRAINEHVSPVLGWGWLIATMMANIVWSLPQFSLATAAVRQNLMPGVFGSMGDTSGKVIVGLAIAILCTIVVVLYDRGQRGAKVCDIILKVMVAVIIVSFFGVVIKLTAAGDGIKWGSVFAGLIPNFSLLSSPPKTLQAEIANVATAYQPFWNKIVVSQQRGVMIAAAATAVGINMTFLLPYSMLRRGWDSEFRGMAIFDLATGLFIPFILVTGCVVIVAATQFHAIPAAGFLGEKDANGMLVQPEKKLVGKYMGLAKKRVAAEIGKEAFAALSADAQKATVAALPEADRRLAAMLVKRDAFGLANSLAPLTGKVYAHYVFGIGVVGMAVSSIIILMLINGFVICEILDKPAHGKPYLIGCLMPLAGILGPFIWRGRTQFWLAVPTSNIAFVLLPIAYLSFAFLLNSKKLLGDAMPTGKARLIWNLLVFPSAGLAAVGSVWKLWTGLGWLGIGILAVVLVLCAVVHTKRGSKAPAAETA
ncbi:MAG: hypothetical protein HN742_00435 [Lentisphaerae bacterium]|nr:hypothetical protein [Lentisphaerota bacterium]MBT5608811.1 hypothetical protein [Lentisphaerota bacterium]MBT7059971.1 hypothetical protein [Lentisphaerota bacterium]MBT7840297.1 hypothetical protein [Lentisphaerota bacterium]